ncbi:hypothetical protein LGQ02_01335 [Bacillus shivajii]|uniref:hypothetical protein n=1 Tax=Bacillus shivajii TaxID=1983719 RepID=UPI001CFC2D50|nr:hypothetical protein [Bacillus shivajii]UCZ53473.1 hypothetical protein LGQ02_01335 [Bacillus shivajii]
MKRLVCSFLVLVLFFGMMTPVFGQGKGNSSTTSSNVDVLKLVEPYVELQEDGTLALEGVPRGLYQAFELENLEYHFDQINKEVLDGNLVIDEELNISETGFSTFHHAGYGSWAYHWWGYQRLFNNSQANEYSSHLRDRAAGAAMVTGVFAKFPPISGIAGVSSGYWALLANRVDANNNGNGVQVSVTWVNVFSVSSL